MTGTVVLIIATDKLFGACVRVHLATTAAHELPALLRRASAGGIRIFNRQLHHTLRRLPSPSREIGPVAIDSRFEKYSAQSEFGSSRLAEQPAMLSCEVWYAGWETTAQPFLTAWLVHEEAGIDVPRPLLIAR